MSSSVRWTLLLLPAALAVASLTTPRSAHAVSVGAFLGLNRCAISGDAPPNTAYGAGAGLMAGAQGELALTRGLSLSLQPMVVQRRTELRSADAAETGDERVLDLDLDYVSVPVVVKFNAAGGRTYFAGGVDVAFLSSARISGEGVDEDLEPLLHSVDVGALFGFGVVFPAGRSRLTTEIRYVQGLVNLREAQQGLVQELPDRFHSSGLQLMAGILFPIGSR